MKYEKLALAQKYEVNPSDVDIGGPNHGYYWFHIVKKSGRKCRGFIPEDDLELMVNGSRRAPGAPKLSCDYNFGKRRSRRSRRGSRRSRKGPRGGKLYKKPKGMTCKEFLSQKIAGNMREFNGGKRLSNGQKITSKRQAIAIAYSQVRRGNPRCKF